MPPAASHDREPPEGTAGNQPNRSLEGFPSYLGAALRDQPGIADAFLSCMQTLCRGRLTPLERVLIALVVSQTNSCAPSLAAYKATARDLGLNEKAIQDACQGTPADPRHRAIVRLAKVLIYVRGHVTSIDIDDARAAGLKDDLIIEVLANTVRVTFENWAHGLSNVMSNPPFLDAAVTSRRWPD